LDLGFRVSKSNAGDGGVSLERVKKRKKKWRDEVALEEHKVLYKDNKVA